MKVEKTGLEKIIEPAVAAAGFELWGVEHHRGGKRPLLRVYIDGPDGVTVDDCALVSRQVGSVLDVEDPIAGEYLLEVSSPGIDRVLFTVEQCRRYAGSRVKVRLRVPFEGKRNFSGDIQGVEDGELVLRVGEDEYLLPVESIDKVSVIGDVDITAPHKG